MRALLAAGHPVTATWVVESERERIERDLGDAGGLTLVEADLTDASATEAAVAGVDELGAVVNLVGGYAGGRRAHELEPEELDRMLTLNLRPLLLLARTAIPRLIARGGGPFVGVSARSAVRPGPGSAAYNSAKAAVLAFIQSLDSEYRDEGVRCNAVLPSIIDTPRNREDMPNADHSRWVAPERIADVIRFLVSDSSEATTGAGIPVYGRA